jgi:hypothetical protein
MVSADSRRVSRAPRYSGARFESRSFSPTQLSCSVAPLSRGLRLTAGLVTLLLRVLQPPPNPKVRWVWALPISLATTYGISLISFPRPTQMLHFGQFVLPSVSMGVIERPHSEILGSTVACTYPRHIAACHVLHHLSSRVILQPASLHQQYYQMFL